MCEIFTLLILPTLVSFVSFISLSLLSYYITLTLHSLPKVYLPRKVSKKKKVRSFIKVKSTS